MLDDMRIDAQEKDARVFDKESKYNVQYNHEIDKERLIVRYRHFSKDKFEEEIKRFVDTYNPIKFLEIFNKTGLVLKTIITSGEKEYLIDMFGIMDLYEGNRIPTITGVYLSMDAKIEFEADIEVIKSVTEINDEEKFIQVINENNTEVIINKNHIY